MTNQIKRRCVIVGGAAIENYEAVKSYLRHDDFVIACDCGMRHMEPLGIFPDLIVGDFDSSDLPMPSLPVETIVLPCEKDDTDTVYAVHEAEKRGYSDYLIIGAVGGRLDHTFGNVSILLHLDTVGCSGMIVDDYSELSIVSRAPAKIRDCYSYFSLLNIDGTASGITIKDAKYPLTNAEISCEYQYGISNEPLPGKTATVSVGSGRLLLCRVRR